MKCIRCGAEIKNNANSCDSCSLEFTDEMKAQMITYENQMAEYNRQMEEYNRQMAEYNQNAQVADTKAESDGQKEMQSEINRQMPQKEMQPEQNRQMLQKEMQPEQNVQMPPMQIQPELNRQIPPMGGQPNVNSQMGMAGYIYGNGNNQPQAKPVKKYVPNILTIFGVIMTVVSVFLPYAKQGNTTNSIWDVFGKGSTTDLWILIGGVVIAVIAFICSFFKNTACKVVSLICSLGVAGVLIFEFVLTIMDKQDYTNAALAYGSIVSAVAAGVLIIAVPIWSLIFRRK